MPDSTDKVAELTSDPAFWASDVSPDDQLGLLRSADPEIGQASPLEQRKFLGSLKLKYMKDQGLYRPARPTAEEKKELEKQDTGEQPGMFGYMGQDVRGMWDEAKRILGARNDPNSNMIYQGLSDLIVDPSVRQYQKGQELWKQGNRFEGGARMAASLVPLAGPVLVGMSEQAGEAAGSGDYSRLAATGVEAGLTKGLTRLPRDVPFAPAWLRPKKTLTPQQEASMAALPLTGKERPSVGQQTGSTFLTQLEQKLPAGEEKFAAQQKKLLPQLRGKAGLISPTATDTVGAGEGMQARLGLRTTDAHNVANKFYNKLRQRAAQYRQDVKVGTKQVPGPNPLATLTPAGMPRTVDVTEAMDLPIDKAPVKASLQGMYNELKSRMTTVQKQYSPAWQALDDFMTNEKPFMPAMEFDKFLGAVKGILRDGDNPNLTNMSQGLARRVINEGEQHLNRAMLQLGPDAPQMLQRARAAVKTRYQTGELLADLPDEPEALFNRLTRAGNLEYNRLTELHRVAPRAMETVGRTYFEGAIQAGMEAPKGVPRQNGFWKASDSGRAWRRIGPRSQALLAGSPQVAQNINGFLDGSETLMHNLQEEGSSANYARRIAMAGQAASLGTALATGLVTGHWEAAASIGATLGISAVLLPRIMSRLLLTESGSRILYGMTRLPVRTLAFRTALGALGANFVTQARAEMQESSEDAQESAQQSQ